MNQQKDKKNLFVPDFALCWPQFGLQIFFPYVLLDAINYFKQSLYATLRKINEQNLRKFQKTYSFLF